MRREFLPIWHSDIELELHHLDQVVDRWMLEVVDEEIIKATRVFTIRTPHVGIEISLGTG